MQFPVKQGNTAESLQFTPRAVVLLSRWYEMNIRTLIQAVVLVVLIVVIMNLLTISAGATEIGGLLTVLVLALFLLAITRGGL